METQKSSSITNIADFKKILNNKGVECIDLTDSNLTDSKNNDIFGFSFDGEKYIATSSEGKNGIDIAKPMNVNSSQNKHGFEFDLLDSEMVSKIIEGITNLKDERANETDSQSKYSRNQNNQAYGNQKFKGGANNTLLLKTPGINYEKAAWNIAGVAMFVTAVVLASTGVGAIVVPFLFLGCVVAFTKAYAAHNEKIQELNIENDNRKYEHKAKVEQDEIKYQRKQKQESNALANKEDEQAIGKFYKQADDVVGLLNKNNYGDSDTSSSPTFGARKWQSDAGRN